MLVVIPFFQKPRGTLQAAALVENTLYTSNASVEPPHVTQRTLAHISRYRLYSMNGHSAMHRAMANILCRYYLVIPCWLDHCYYH